MKKKLFLSLFISVFVIMLTVLSTSCENKDSAAKIRIGYFPNITHTQALLGIKQDAFTNALKDQAEVSFTSFNAGPAEINAFFADEIDIGYIGPIPAINGFVKSNGDVKIISGASNGGAVLVTRKDSGITTVAQLDSKKIAVPQFGNTQHLELLKILSDNNLKTVEKGGNIQVVESANADIKTLMDKGDIDAALVPEPWGTRLINEIGANLLLDYDKLMFDGDYSTACVIVSTKFLKEHPELVKKFLETHIELTDKLNADTESAITEINEAIRQISGSELNENDLRAAFGKLKLTADPSVKSIKSFIEIYKNEGMIEIKEDINMNELFDLTVLNEVLKEKNLPEIKAE